MMIDSFGSPVFIPGRVFQSDETTQNRAHFDSLRKRSAGGGRAPKRIGMTHAAPGRDDDPLICRLSRPFLRRFTRAFLHQHLNGVDCWWEKVGVGTRPPYQYPAAVSFLRAFCRYGERNGTRFLAHRRPNEPASNRTNRAAKFRASIKLFRVKRGRPLLARLGNLCE